MIPKKLPLESDNASQKAIIADYEWAEKQITLLTAKNKRLEESCLLNFPRDKQTITTQQALIEKLIEIANIAKRLIDAAYAVGSDYYVLNTLATDKIKVDTALAAVEVQKAKSNSGHSHIYEVNEQEVEEKKQCGHS